MTEVSPMVKQYLDVKKNYQDSILLFRLGDFYEMFFDDAVYAARILDLTLTSRNKNKENSIPLCGIPVHASQSYINKLLQTGHKVAICEQIEDPQLAKGIVKREVVSVLTPGAVLDPDCLDSKSPHFLVSVVIKPGFYGLGIVDITTGIFKACELPNEEKLIDELKRLDPKEVIISEASKDTPWMHALKHSSQFRLSILAGWHFDFDYSKDLLTSYYGLNWEALALDEFPTATIALGSLLSLLKENKVLKPGMISRPKMYFNRSGLFLDKLAISSLDLIDEQKNMQSKGSLFWLLDCAQTSMGSRLIREWILAPLIDLGEIKKRQEVVLELVEDSHFLGKLKEILKQISDIERIQNRVIAQSANARDLISLASSLQQIPFLIDLLKTSRTQLFNELADEMDCLKENTVKILQTLFADPPLSLKEGNLIRDGINFSLDELRDIEKNGKSYIASLEIKEREASKISSLKIRYNRVFGYYIEITNTHKDKIPLHYIRKQTLSNAERFITPELKEYEDKILGASEKIKQIEYQIFVDLREELKFQTEKIKKNARAISMVDALSALAFVALERHYVCPEMTNDTILEVEGGRHPLVEALVTEEPFVPNDITMGEDKNLLLITGPNMAGKSTVMRQTALIVIMAQMGSFVPATKARLGIVDRIFTRIGASDFLQKGLSTFMVEMLETASILRNATSKSLILLDEIGRGTSTFDGLSIAWAVAEMIHDEIKARTLFATHYHELTDLALERKGIANYQMLVKEWNGKITFLRELKPGAANRSYGIFVGQMAGLPLALIKRARKILSLLEEKDLSFQTQVAFNSHQPTLFDDVNLAQKEMMEKLRQINADELSPRQALDLIYTLKKEQKKNG
ncbi:MAG: DNA mismatch repair protein MutS [Deltaproteobacteria bacterium RIFCSPLOWO2_12_FULL_40_28]|nr:MAG: DNA mismatch repair protein MutS [Deltaproteobacteria bacterium RIFCSPHIGHO2_02_FULL_40_28]OGQ20996.1 MAG: DNA mismatch repair protein MutS [Deltaproteobacteria bacterium RIFCSPHIGHO2_12_FULL_40_32]OGQ39397.1 MAG: DNA mismatch repair protein MutS [Deltaproteobacteria bacterium RIFCSPLOWO2_02_FULL_40_36]OGQ54678.1 MAG: DNA mismatch repair protein MutS [Deltaproteobacteria bacterium RIFCSPLOWO2_12_FULL_40_28]